MAELVADHPDRFPGFIGTAVMADPDAMVEDARRNIEELGASGMQIFTNVAGKPLDLPEFEPFFAYMAEAGKPVWMHPARGANFPDYLTEEQSEYEIWWTFGWPYETSAAMARMVFSGLFDRYPGLKVITHHAGGMMPFFEGRVGPGWDQMGARTTDHDLAAVRKGLKKPHLEYFKDFYADTASFGSRRRSSTRWSSSARITCCSPPTRLSIPRAGRCISARRSDHRRDRHARGDEAQDLPGQRRPAARARALSMSDDIDPDVVIIGGGPVGMGLAIELGQRGIPSRWSSATRSRSRSPRART